MELKYVTRKSTEGARRLIRECFNKLRIKLKDKQITFSAEMVGSAKRNLILIPVKANNMSNAMFDIDYNVFLYQRGGMDVPNLFKVFKNEMSKIMNSQMFTLESSTSKALKFYYRNKKVKKWSYEIVTFVRNNDDLNLFDITTNQLKYEKKYKSSSERLQYIKKYKLGNKLRDEYKKIREKNFGKDVKSYESFLAAVNSVWMKASKSKKRI
jgi:hypothetical protein